MGCGSSKSQEIADLNNNDEKGFVDEMADPENEKISISDTEDGYPPPKPPRTKKADIFQLEDFVHIDNRARKTPVALTNSWDELISYLMDGCKTDLERLRAIFIWLGTLDFDAVPNKNADPDSLQATIRGLKEKKVSYAVFFTYLCRLAKLPCVLIRGNGKSVAYEVGDSVEKVSQLNNIWNAVYVDGDWRLVVPLWACQSVVGHSTSKYTLVESQGAAVRGVETASEGTTVSNLDENYFLTDPEQLVVVLLAKDPKWQLLDKPYTLEKFCSIPYIREGYFEHDLKIKSEFNGCNNAKEGISEIVIAANRKSWDGTLTYKLFFNHEESENGIPEHLQLDRYVIMGRELNTWTFIVRFPVVGIYKITIFDGELGSWICDYKLVCDQAKNNVQPLPCNPGLIGFGPTRILEAYGLSDPSQTSGIVIINKTKHINFRFTIKRKVHIRSELVHNEVNTQVLQQYVSQRIQSKSLYVSVNVPQNGEYALRMYSKNKETNIEDNVCNYLLTSDDPNITKRTRENPTEKRARENLKAIMDSRSPREIEDAIEKCNKLHLDDKGDLSKALERKNFLEVQQEIRDAINRRHIEILEKAITHVQGSDYASELQSEIEKAKEVLDQLKRLKGFLHDILEMKQSTVAEIRSYNSAQPITYHIMKATYILLGEEEDTLKDWTPVRKLIGLTGNQGLIRRIKKFDFVHLTAAMVKSAKRKIKKYDRETAQKASAGVGTFFVWV